MGPGREHALLKRFEGTWDFKSRLVTGRGEERGRGVRRARMDYGGYWLIVEDECERVKGLVTIGFDPGRRAYVLTGLSGGGPGSCVLYGTAEGDGRVLRFQGTWTEPAAETSARVQLVYEFEGPDRISMRFQHDDGTKVGEFIYTRMPS